MSRPRLPVAPPGITEGTPEDSGPRRSRRLVPTPTDVDLFRWLWMLRVLSLDQLRRLGYYQPKTGRLSSLDNVRKRLHRLWDKGYLVGNNLLTRERIYFLGERALASLRDEYGIWQRRLYKPKGMETMGHVRHALLVSECAVRITEAVRRSTVQIPDLAPLGVPFYHTHAVGDPSKRKHVERFVTQEDLRVPGIPEAMCIRPDLVFALEKASGSRLYLLEADRGSESPQEIALKQRGYFHYKQARDPQEPAHHLWQRYGLVRDFRVLFVTTTDRRIELLRHKLQDKPGFELLAFTTIDQLKEHNPVFDPIWTAHTGRTMALIEHKKKSLP